MDLLNKKLKDLNLYEVKLYVRKAQNVVYNYTEMEAKVREATNNEPWGALLTLMHEIAAGTYNYREREEIMGMIFRRFTEKASNEWRQIYKLLQLLEYLVKHGLERLVDDARQNVNIITMLRSFHYIDLKGRDQGINVRNRAKQLAALLNNESEIREERKKARKNAKKFAGVAGGASSIQPGRSGGFDEYEEEEYGGRVFGDGGVYGERDEEERRAGTPAHKFEEYNVGSEQPRRTATGSSTTATSAATATSSRPAAPVDLFSFDAPAATTAPDAVDDDDEFDDFQSAPPAPAPGAAPAPSQGLNLTGLYGSGPTAAPAAPAAPGASGFSSFGITPAPVGAPQTSASYAAAAPAAAPAPTAAPKADAFSSLFLSAVHLTPAAPRPSSTAAPAATASAAPKTSAFDDDIFGAPATAAPSTPAKPTQSALNDLDLLSF